jgi:hypothetical protein
MNRTSSQSALTVFCITSALADNSASLDLLRNTFGLSLAGIASQRFVLIVI